MQFSADPIQPLSLRLCAKHLAQMRNFKDQSYSPQMGRFSLIKATFLQLAQSAVFRYPDHSPLPFFRINTCERFATPPFPLHARAICCS